MKLTVFFFVPFLVCCYAKTITGQTSGGPDAFGYTWVNNQNPQGPVYNWKDIRSKGIALNGLKDDNESGPFNLGFNFRYYGIDYDSIWIGSNGWISFENIGNVPSPFPSIPTASGPDNYIAGMLSDLTLVASDHSAVPGASAFFWTNNIDSAIVQYDSIPFWANGTPGYSGRNTFQIILSGNSVTFQYKRQINATPAYDLTNEGLTTGIENSTGQTGLQVLSDTFPLNSSAVKFFYPGAFSVDDPNNHALLLYQNFPNPCTDFTEIKYVIENSKNVEIEIHNIIGEKVETISSGNQCSGNHSIRLNVRSYNQGIYFYTISAGKMRITKKFTVYK